MEKNTLSLPEECYSVLPTTGAVVLIKKGESGFYEVNTHTGDTGSNQMYVNEMNKRLCVSKAQEAAMVAGSMFGWDCRAALPSSYDEKGNPIKRTVPSREHTR